MSLQGVTPSFEQHHISCISSFFFLRTATDPAVYSTSGTSRPMEFIDVVSGRFVGVHITKRSEPVLQWSKANFFTFFLASFFNAIRKKLVTLNFYIFHEIK